MVDFKNTVIIMTTNLGTRDMRAGAVGSSPRRGTRERGIACFILADAGSPAPVVNDHCANGGQGGTGHAVVVAAQQESN